jgi:hypothetical protein
VIHYDACTGPAADLIAAGLVRADQAQVRIGVSVDIARHRRAADAAKRKSYRLLQAAQDDSKELAAAIEVLRAMVLSMLEPIEPGPETKGD